jgi:acetyl esterase/lipase
VPKGLDRSQVELGGVPTERLVPSGATGDDAILYLHGGAFVLGSPRVQRVAAARLALGASATSFAPDYRLAPEHRFPAAYEDCLAAYAALAEGHGEGRIALAGDSAGGGLALSVALGARDAGLPAPAGLFLICPWVDLGTDRSQGRDTDPILARSFLAEGSALYLDGADPADPRCSPINGELAGLPPMLVHTADEDPLRPDAEALVSRAEAAGLEVALERFPLWHDFHMHAGVLDVANDALDQGSEFIRSCL